MFLAGAVVLAVVSVITAWVLRDGTGTSQDTQALSYTVRAGDTLSSICERTKVDTVTIGQCVNAVISRNQLSNAGDLYVGQVLEIPMDGNLPSEAPLSPPAAASITNPQVCGQSPSPGELFCFYTVQDGDTISGVAQRFNLAGSASFTPWELLVESNKPDLISEDDILAPGQQLVIPLQNGVLHTLLPTETLSAVAAAYGVNVQAIVSANHLVDQHVSPGTLLLVPDPTKLPSTSAVVP
jgi:LysM repeat protein